MMQGNLAMVRDAWNTALRLVVSRRLKTSPSSSCGSESRVGGGAVACCLGIPVLRCCRCALLRRWGGDSCCWSSFLPDRSRMSEGAMQRVSIW
ncbi:hypothetical protein DUNSADRAFT_15208 [Dunaliella salina]|uniref:Encoded protein n=1 Tax=Dunaliella salina TaxID=3046 RepID=A0ABQ7G5T6_DUNSA|nr:hypothetical protein DUNSADRAFT_15208 [Dunaliella salina]|eukprot:KAF5829972.1 hypothetical protein DUNSADRAFT_15208 [Dunaliella salina]